MLRYDSFLYVTKTASTSRTFYDDTVGPVRFRIFSRIVVAFRRVTARRYLLTHSKQDSASLAQHISSLNKV